VRLERLIRLCIRGILSRLQLIRAQLEQSPRDARLWTLEGIAFSGAGSDKQAMVAYNRALSISPDFLAALEGAAGLEFKAESDRAIPLLNRISKLRPAEPTSHAMLGVLAYRKHDCATAVGHFRQARLVLPSQPMYKHESYQVGVDMVNAGVKVLPTAASLYVARGILYIQMGNFQSGEADFETANKLDPRQASAAVAQGLAQLQQSNLDQALATVGEQLKSHPKDSFLHLFEGGNPDAEGRGCGVAGV
jgi:tetratricopeptide (TPR) repeat protein